MISFPLSFVSRALSFLNSFRILLFPARAGGGGGGGGHFRSFVSGSWYVLQHSSFPVLAAAAVVAAAVAAIPASLLSLLISSLTGWTGTI